MTPDHRTPRHCAVRRSAAALFPVIFAALSALPAAAEIPAWQLPPNARSQHFVDHPNRQAEQRVGGIVSYAPRGDVHPPGWADPGRVIRTGTNRGVFQQTGYQTEGDIQGNGSDETIYEGEGPVLYGGEGPTMFAGEGEVVYEDGGPTMMGGPGGFVSPRRAMEDYWNSPASDRGYPCYPVWFPFRDRLYLRGEYLVWWAKGSTLAPWPDLVDGGIRMNNGTRSGARFTLGYWFDPCHSRGIEVTYLSLNTRTDQYLNGIATLDARSDFHGLEVLFRKAMIANGCNRFDVVLGYRNLYLEDDLQINAQAAPVDQIHTTNRFNGFELGFVGRTRRCRWTLETQMKLALGNTNSAIRRDVFSVDDNLDNFAMVSELGATLGYDVAPRLRATVGYTFLYWSVVARPGDQLTFLPPAQTVPVTTDYWAQGLNFGLEWQF